MEAFQTLADFEYAEIALAAGLTKKQNGALLALINRIVAGEVEFTLKKASDLEKVWEKASSKIASVSHY